VKLDAVPIEPAGNVNFAGDVNRKACQFRDGHEYECLTVTFAVAGEMARTSYSLEEYIVSEALYFISLVLLSFARLSCQVSMRFDFRVGC